MSVHQVIGVHTTWGKKRWSHGFGFSNTWGPGSAGFIWGRLQKVSYNDGYLKMVCL